MIKGDYWIKSGRIQSVAGGYDKDQHNEIAHNFVAKKYVEDMISYARGLGINVFHYTIYQDKYPGSTVASLMNVLLKKLGKSEAVGVRELQRIFKIDEETFDALSEAEEAMVYVQKHFGWIAAREMNIELFGLDYDKGRILLRGLNRIFEREKLLGSESMKFTIFDHKTGRTINVTYEDILDGNFFKAGRIPQAGSSWGRVSRGDLSSESISLDFRGFLYY